MIDRSQPGIHPVDMHQSVPYAPDTTSRLDVIPDVEWDDQMDEPFIRLRPGIRLTTLRESDVDDMVI